MNSKFKSVIKTVVPMPLINFAVRKGQRLYDLQSIHGGRGARKVLRRADQGRLEYFNRALPSSDCFPYEVHNPVLLQDLNFNPGPLYLVGRNWKTVPQKPIALCFGFNDWKLGFMAEYIQDHKTAFVPKTLQKRKVRRLIKEIRPEVFYVWGYKEPKWLEAFAREHKIKIIRVEDGFVRSAQLGAAHTTPYSLVFDDVGGMHYNTDEPNRLENILNTYDFFSNPQLIDQGREIRAQIIHDGISKYNQPTLVTAKDTFSIKTSKRVLILGQVEKDAAIRLGNPNDWSSLQMIQLAKLENPHAEIIYKPHPDVYAGYQKSIFRARQVDSYARVLPPDVPVHQALMGIDHVYTITSLTGMEALIRGIKVTTLGIPFYGGWGLTDDRCEFKRRERTLSLDELFAGIYLKYPTYLAKLDDPVLGLKASILRIGADKRLNFPTNVTDRESFSRIGKTNKWPQLVLHPSLQQEPYFDLVQSGINIAVTVEYIRNLDGELSKIAIVHTLIGWLKSDEKCRVLLNNIREIISLKSFNELLIRISSQREDLYLIDQFSWLLDQVDKVELSTKMIQERLNKPNNITESQDANKPSLDLISDASNVDETHQYNTIDSSEHKSKNELYLNLLDSSLKETNYDVAVNTALNILIRGHTNLDTLLKLAEVSATLFDLISCKEIASFIFDSGYPSIINKATTLMYRSTIDLPYNELSNILAMFAVTKPSNAGIFDVLVRKLFEGEDYEENVAPLNRLLFMDNQISIGKAQGWLALNRPDLSLEVVDTLIRTHEAAPSLSVIHSQALSYSGRIEQAKGVIFDALKAYPVSMVYREALRTCILMGDYSLALSTLKEAQKNYISLGDMTPRKIYFGARMPGLALNTFRDIRLKENVRRHYIRKYCDAPKYNYPSGTILFLPIFGPGDELRFASIYNDIKTIAPHKTITIACEPRLETLYKRSFPKINFIPVKRLRGTDTYDLEDYNKLASSGLIGALDNNGVEAIEAADEFALVTDMLAECLKDYEDFKGRPYLKASPNRVKELSKRFSKKKPLIGLSWRSSLNTHSRNEHYLSIENLAPILAIDGVQFVNLQYDECDDELAWAEEHFPGKIVNLDGIDQYNDFDSVSALMKCMDLIIAPATTVVELAGALGCPTWLLSNSSELYWREIDEKGTDVWHHSVTHVKGDRPKDKKSLVENLEIKLKSYVSENTT